MDYLGAVERLYSLLPYLVPVSCGRGGALCGFISKALKVVGILTEKPK